MQSWKLPIKTVSEANRANELWYVKKQRHEKQTYWLKLWWRHQKPDIKLPCKITFVRIAPRQLDDFENLPMSMKWLKDCLADLLIPGLAKGRADDDNRIEWAVKQEKGKPKEYAIRVIVEPFVVKEDYEKDLLIQ